MFNYKKKNNIYLVYYKCILVLFHNMSVRDVKTNLYLHGKLFSIVKYSFFPP